MTEAVTLICLDCSAVLKRSRTGRCGSCAARARFADPSRLASFRVSAARGAAKRMSKPDELARLRSTMLANRAPATPELISKANASRDRTIMGWCPPEYRDLNTTLRRRGKTLVERKRIIAGLAAAQARRVLDADAAASFLARLAPTYRCDERGQPCRTAGYWRHGSVVLTRDALIDRAGRRGWPPAATLTTAGAPA